jgi:hypothetical protein
MRRRRLTRAAATGCLAAALAFAACGSPEPSPEPPATLAPTPPAPTPAATAPPATNAPEPAPTLPAAASVEPITPTTTNPPAVRSPVPSPPATLASPREATPPPVDHARVTRLVSEGELALGQGKVAEADTLFEEALTLDANSSAARRGKARAATTRLGLSRNLVPEVASSEGAEGRLKQLDGFDDVEEMNVKRAVRVPGRTELDAARGRLKPGDTYRVDIYLRNTSRKKKNIRLENVNIRRFVNDKESLVEVPWNKVEVRPKQRLLVATVTGPWEDDVSSWILHVRLLSEGGDIYENRLLWR